MGKNIQLREKVLEATEGVCATAVDVMLLLTFFGVNLAAKPMTTGGVRKATREADDLFEKINYQEIKKAIYRAREKGWIRPGEIRLTKEGQKRIQGFVPEKYESLPWDGKWHIVLFDIEEKARGKRDALRLFLKRLGFGKLFESTWISPLPLLGDVEKFVHQNHLSSQVILSISDKVGTEGSRDLASRIWNLQEVNQSYKEFLYAEKVPSQKRIFQYLSIAQKDPKLPQQLLPLGWKGKAAFEYYQQLLTAVRRK